MHHPTHHCIQGKDAGPASRRVPQKGHSMHSKEAALPPRRRTTNIHASQAKMTEPSQAAVPPRANATATPHSLPYIGRGTVKTTNPTHTPPTRNHPADKQTPPQYKAEKPDAIAEPSDACPAAPTLGGQSCRTKDHRPNTTARHTAEE
ncbi:hypothetical protein XENORESO_012187 [Xenotaenia resolanae]|uniref:Uncharacterized protein n=1 Tax=Xenotaenia resolanae TaxID=208358 RepID=A0ABV0WAR0_9TELE